MEPFLLNFFEQFTYFSLSLPLLGIVGNVFMFLVFTRSHMRQKLTVSVYLASMALVNLLINLNWFKLVYQVKTNVYVNNTSHLACKLDTFLGMLICPCSAWLLVAAGIDRLVSILFPVKSQLITHHKRYLPTLIVLFILAYNAAVYFNTLIGFNLVAYDIPWLNATIYSCEYSGGNPRTLDLIDVINSVFIPFACMITTSVLIIVGVFVRRRRAAIAAAVAATSTPALVSKFTKWTLKRREVRDLKFGVTLVVLNVIFLILNAASPAYDWIIYYFELTVDPDRFYVLSMVLLSLNCSFYSLEFYIQLGVNSLVRSKFLELLSTMTRCSLTPPRRPRVKFASSSHSNNNNNAYLSVLMR